MGGWEAEAAKGNLRGEGGCCGPESGPKLGSEPESKLQHLPAPLSTLYKNIK